MSDTVKMPDSETRSTMEIQINGQRLAIESSATIASIISTRRPRPPFAVEINKQLVRRPQYSTTALKEGDRVEIVTLVGGG